MTNDLRERVARALEGEHVLDLHGSRIGMNHLNISPKTADLLASAAIAAMGLPTRDAVESEISTLMDAAWSFGIGEGSDADVSAARQRLLDMIVMTEVNDER